MKTHDELPNEEPRTTGCPDVAPMRSLAASGQPRDLIEHVGSCKACLDLYTEMLTWNRPQGARKAVASMLALVGGAGVATVFILTILVPGWRANEFSLRSRLEKSQAGLIEQRAIANALKRQLEILEGPTAKVAPGPEAKRWLALVAAARSRGSLEVPAKVWRLSAKARGPQPPGLRLTSPVATFVLDQQPILEAQAVPEVENMKATLTDEAGRQVELGRLRIASWRVAAALRPGGLYRWQVAGVREGTEVRASASFEVLDLAQATEVRRAQAQFRGQPVVIAVICARAGLLDEAERALEGVSVSDPLRRDAERLLRDLQIRRAQAR